MNKNVGGTDKTLRIIVGLLIILLGIISQSWWGLLGLIPLGTALVGRCPAYLPFGISTCKTKSASEK